MKNIMRKFKRFMLNSKIEKYEFKLMVLDGKSEMYHEMILDGIRKGKNEVDLNILRMERDEVVNKLLQLVEKRNDLLKKLRRA